MARRPISTARPRRSRMRHAPAASRRIAPELCKVRPPSAGERVQGMPDAGRTHGPPAEKTQAAVTTGSAETTGIPRATVLTLIRDLPGDRLDCPRRLRARRNAGLTSAPGGQDHTISRPRQCARPAPLPASTAPRTPRIVTTRTPLFDEAGSREISIVSEKKKAQFFGAGTDTAHRPERADEIGFCATHSVSEMAARHWTWPPALVQPGTTTWGYVCFGALGRGPANVRPPLLTRPGVRGPSR
jgi:hypothetical protein